MEETPKNQDENVGGNSDTTIDEMPSFEEHMENREKDASIGEKYYEQAKAEKARWIETARGELVNCENMKPAGLKKLTNPEIFDFQYTGERRPEYRPLDENNAEDMAEFSEYKTDRIEGAKKQLAREENADLDELARAFRNQEYIDNIAVKLEKNEELNEKEKEFLGDTPICDDELFDTEKFSTPDTYRTKHYGFIEVPRYKDLLDPEDEWGYIEERPQWAIVARAQMREMAKQDRALLHNDEKIQKTLGSMSWRRQLEPFEGETNTNSATGEARTFTPEDNYPQLERESDAEYRGRMRKIGRIEQLWKKRH